MNQKELDDLIKKGGLVDDRSIYTGSSPGVNNLKSDWLVVTDRALSSPPIIRLCLFLLALSVLFPVFVWSWVKFFVAAWLCAWWLVGEALLVSRFLRGR